MEVSLLPRLFFTTYTELGNASDSSNIQQVVFGLANEIVSS